MGQAIQLKKGHACWVLRDFSRGDRRESSQPHQQLNAQLRGHLQLDGAAVQRAKALIVNLDRVVVAGKGDLQGLPISQTACLETRSQSTVSYVLLASAMCCKDQGWLQHAQGWSPGT